MVKDLILIIMNRLLPALLINSQLHALFHSYNNYIYSNNIYRIPEGMSLGNRLYFIEVCLFVFSSIFLIGGIMNIIRYFFGDGDLYAGIALIILGINLGVLAQIIYVKDKREMDINIFRAMAAFIYIWGLWILFIFIIEFFNFEAFAPWLEYALYWGTFAFLIISYVVIVDKRVERYSDKLALRKQMLNGSSN